MAISTTIRPIAVVQGRVLNVEPLTNKQGELYAYRAMLLQDHFATVDIQFRADSPHLTPTVDTVVRYRVEISDSRDFGAKFHYLDEIDLGE